MYSIGVRGRFGLASPCHGVTGCRIYAKVYAKNVFCMFYKYSKVAFSRSSFDGRTGNQ